jgi:hypothetical protein
MPIPGLAPLSPPVSPSLTTNQYWLINGIPLQTFAYNIVTLGGGRMGVPPLRGEDILVPYRQGKLAMPRIPDSRTITLGMWVQGSEPTGKLTAPGVTMRNLFNRNWERLRSLFWNPDDLMVVTKRWESASGQIIEASAKARFAGALDPQMFGPYHAAFTVDLFLADPFFYGDQVTEPFEANQTRTLNILGDWATFDIELEMGEGSRFSNPLLKGTVWSQLSKPGTLHVKDFTIDSAADSVHTHGGAYYWFQLNQGLNNVSVVGPASTLRYRPVYV